MQSTTITTTGRPSIVLHLRSKPDYDQLLEELTTILTRYTTWTDPLSLRMYKWSVKMLKLAPAFTELSKTEVREQMNAKIEKLYYTILRNPLSPGTPLSQPLLERTWVWEANDLFQWRRSLRPCLSPFDGKPIEEAIPHQFAMDILNLVKRMRGEPVNAPLPKEEHALIQESSELDPQGPLIVLFFSQAAKSYLQSLELEKLKKAAKKTENENIAELNEVLERNREHLANFQLQCEERARYVDQKIEELRKARETLAANSAATSKEHEERIRALEAEIANQTSRIAQQQVELHRLQQEVQRRAEELERVNKKSKGGCILF